jgi:hypothetical protein
MNRLVAALVFGLVFGLANVSDACHRCGRSACVSSCAPRCTTVYRTTYVNVVKCVPVTICKKVRYRDSCGCCRTKIVRCTVYVKRCCRIPVTTCQTVCCEPAPTVCCDVDPCCQTARRGCFGRHHRRCCL